MKAMKQLLMAGAILTICVSGASSQTPERNPENLTLTLAWIADSENTANKEYVFVVNGLVAYRTLEGLKKYIRGLPK